MGNPGKSEREDLQRSGLEAWRYVVLISCFSVRFLLVGLLKSYGILIPFLVIQLQTSYATTGFIVTSQLALTYLLSPLANLLLLKLNSRLVVVCGSCVAGFALLGTAWAEASWSMGLCLILSGSSLSVLMQYMVIILKEHYHEFFGFANTVSHSGSVIGALIIPYIAMQLYIAYGLYGTMSCLGALSLNMIPLSMTLKPPRLLRENEDSKETERLVHSETRNEKETIEECSKTVTVSHLDSLKAPPTSCVTLNGDNDFDEKEYLSKTLKVVSSSEEDKEEIEDFIPLTASKDGYAGNIIQGDHLSFLEHIEKWFRRDRMETGKEVMDVVSRSKDMCRMLFTFLLEALAYDSLRNEIAFSLTVLPCRFLMDISYIGWLVFMVSYALSVGVEASQAVYLPVAASAGGLAARVSIGIILLWRPHSSPVVFASLTSLSALSLFTYTISSSLVNLVCCSLSSGFGLFGAASIYYAMLAEVVDVENFPGVLAISSCFTGVGMFLSGFLTGLMFDLTGSFPFTFGILGCLIAITSIVTIIYLCCRARH